MTDYSQIPVPEHKPPKEYTYNERRAEIVRLIEKKGHPWGFNKSELGRRYGVSDVQIHKDFDRIREWYRGKIGNDAMQASDLAYRRIIQEQMERGEYEKARRALDSWNEWLEDRGQQEKVPEKMEMDLDASVETEERKALIGVDLDQFDGVDTSQMVGLDLSDADSDDGEETVPDGVEITDDEDEGGDTDE